MGISLDARNYFHIVYVPVYISFQGGRYIYWSRVTLSFHIDDLACSSSTPEQ